MKYPKISRRVGMLLAGATIVAGSAIVLTQPVEALKYAKREHNMKADPRIPLWVPGPLVTVPEEEFNVVGADVMDEMTLGWVKMMRKAYPRLSVTMEARASGAGGPGLTSGIL